MGQEIPSHTEALSSFIAFFKHDLTSFIQNSSKNSNNKHKFRCVVMGGYGLKTVLERKYNLHDKVHTNDLDITVSTYNSEFNEQQLLDYWVSKVFAFIRTQPNQKDYKVSVIQGPLYVPIMDYTRTAIIMISHKYQEFVDIAITNAKIPKAELDQPTSLQVGLPVKKLNGYLLELLTIIYRSNVQDVAPELYEKRNPVTGYYRNKGINDINRAKLICQIPRQKKYQVYCDIIKKISIPKLLQKTEEERDTIFNALNSLLQKRKRVVKKLLTLENSKYKTIHHTYPFNIIPS